MLASRFISLPATGLAVALALAVTAPSAAAAQSKVGLGTATSFAVLAGSTVTNTGPTIISGDVGVSPGTAVVGFPPGIVIVNSGTIHAADAVALKAKDDLTTAYNDAAGRGPVVDETGKNLGGQTLQPGVYNASSEMALTGTLILDAAGDPDAVFVFQAGSTLITASSSTVALIGAAQACNVFWQVGSSATFGTGTTFVGTVMALTDITMQTGAIIQGRLLARTGQVALDTNVITRPGCSVTPSSPSPSPSPTGPSDDSSETETSGGGGDGGGDGSGESGPGGPSSGGPGSPGLTGGPAIPTGHPETGRHAGDTASAGLWLAVGLVCLGGAAGAAFLGSRRRVIVPNA